MTTNLSLDEQLVSVVASDLRAAADISNYIINGSASQSHKDCAVMYLNEYHSRVDAPSFPSSDFRSLYSGVRDFLETRLVKGHYLKLWFWGCFAASLFNGSFLLSSVSGAVVAGAHFYSDWLKKKKSLVSRAMNTVLNASDEVYRLAFEKLQKLHEEQYEGAHVSS